MNLVCKQYFLSKISNFAASLDCKNKNKHHNFMYENNLWPALVSCGNFAKPVVYTACKSAMPLWMQRSAKKYSQSGKYESLEYKNISKIKNTFFKVCKVILLSILKEFVRNCLKAGIKFYTGWFKRSYSNGKRGSVRC